MFQLFGIQFTPMKIACAIAFIIVAGFLAKKFYSSRKTEKYQESMPQEPQEEHYEDMEEDYDDLEDFEDSIGSDMSSEGGAEGEAPPMDGEHFQQPQGQPQFQPQQFQPSQ